MWHIRLFSPSFQKQHLNLRSASKSPGSSPQCFCSVPRTSKQNFKRGVFKRKLLVNLQCLVFCCSFEVGKMTIFTIFLISQFWISTWNTKSIVNDAHLCFNSKARRETRCTRHGPRRNYPSGCDMFVDSWDDQLGSWGQVLLRKKDGKWHIQNDVMTTSL